jgi:hypothetical protein
MSRITHITGQLFGRSFVAELAAITLLVGPNQSGKSTSLGVPDLVIRGGSAGVYPVLGRPSGAWSATITLNGKAYTRGGRDGTANACRIDGVKVAVRDLDAAVSAAAGSAGVWRLSELTSASPAQRLSWLVGTLLAGADTAPLAAAIETALGALGPLREALGIPAGPWTPEQVQALRERLTAQLEREGLNAKLEPRSGRSKPEPLPPVPTDRQVGQALGEILSVVLRLAARTRRAAAKQAAGEVERLEARVAALGEQPPGTVASQRERAEALQAEVDALKERRVQQEEDLRRRESAERGVVEASDLLNQARVAAGRTPEALQDAIDQANQAWATAKEAADDAERAVAAAEKAVVAAQAHLASVSEDLNASSLIAERHELAKAAAASGDSVAAASAAVVDDLEGLVSRGGLSPRFLERPSIQALTAAVADYRAARASAAELTGLVSDLAPLREARTVAQADLRTAQATHERGQRTLGDLRAKMQGHNARLQGLVAEQREIREQAVNRHNFVQRCERSLIDARQRLGSLPVVAGLDLLDATIAAKQAERAEAIAAADRLSDAASEVARLESARADRLAAQTALDTIEAVVDAITAATAGWLSAELAGALEPATRITRAVLGQPVAITTSDDGAHIMLGDVDLDAVQGDQLRSPQIVALAALRVAVLSRMPGLRALFVDDLEAIDAGRRALFLQAVAVEVRNGTIDQMVGAVADISAAVTRGMIEGDDVRVIELSRES